MCGCVDMYECSYLEEGFMLGGMSIEGKRMRAMRQLAIRVVAWAAIGLFAGGGAAIGQRGALADRGAGFSQPSGIEILSDTRGVDFAPYLRQAMGVIRKAWINYLPQE